MGVAVLLLIIPIALRISWGKEDSMNIHTQRVKIQNDHSYSLTIHLEPWGEEIPISPGVTYELVSKGPPGIVFFYPLRSGAPSCGDGVDQ